MGEEPGTSPSTIWLNVSQFFNDNSIFNSYLIAGYEIDDVKILQQYIRSVSQGLGGDCDATSVPGQPFIANQTLARRLGFTWDGTGLRTDINTILTEGISYGSTIALYINRLRPLLPYDIVLDVLFEGNELGAFYDVDRNPYTADGYCNLVYSSIINIYTTIIGTSSVDTQRDGNLLAMVPMNCGNLGVAIVDNYINTRLTKIQPDIYSIYFELRDENGEPYLLTNNATVSLLLKLTYD